MADLANTNSSALAVSEPKFTAANAITLAGYAAWLAWYAGGPTWLGIVGLIADEADGRAARAMGEATKFGSLLDWGVDLTLTGLAAQKAGLLPLLPAVTVAQVAMREQDVRPPIGSARAAFTLLAMLKKASK